MILINRLYLDFNATSPLSPMVRERFFSCSDRSSDLELASDVQGHFANPGAKYFSAQESLKVIHQTAEFILTLFKLPKHRVIFHSGGTEGINLLLKGWAVEKLQLEARSGPKSNSKLLLCYSTADHPCVVGSVDWICRVDDAYANLFAQHRPQPQLLRTQLPRLHQLELGILDNALPDDKQWATKISEQFSEQFGDNALMVGRSLLNFTYVNNETGVAWPLKLASNIKSQCGALVHVDAVQLLGRLSPEYWQLAPDLDFYTFSGHKFGALPGIGFSLVSNNIPPFTLPLISGGGQRAERGGSENVLGIYSLKLALEDLVAHYNYEENLQGRNYLEERLQQLLGERGVFFAKEAERKWGGRAAGATFLRSSNTIAFAIKGVSADSIQMALDLQGIEVGRGAACSSGINQTSRVLKAMGVEETLSKVIPTERTSPSLLPQ
ncbi:MAG: aminotransferase class V-fold PLP-dependent enzyme [Oligoflexia bacterium]|nr:aminotransferase class V-fold PLP-dependent enzyme [Oligoflexia bacterium]